MERRGRFEDAKNARRTVYGFVSRRKLDSTLALFDFPNPNAAAEKRIVTLTPPQQLYFLNGDFVWDRAMALANRITGGGQDRRGADWAAYRRVFARDPLPSRVEAWARVCERRGEPLGAVCAGAAEFQRASLCELRGLR